MRGKKKVAKLGDDGVHRLRSGGRAVPVAHESDGVEVPTRRAHRPAAVVVHNLIVDERQERHHRRRHHECVGREDVRKRCALAVHLGHRPRHALGEVRVEHLVRARTDRAGVATDVGVREVEVVEQRLLIAAGLLQRDHEEPLKGGLRLRRLQPAVDEAGERGVRQIDIVAQRVELRVRGEAARSAAS